MYKDDHVIVDDVMGSTGSTRLHRNVACCWPTRNYWQNADKHCSALERSIKFIICTYQQRDDPHTVTTPNMTKINMINTNAMTGAYKSEVDYVW